MIYAAKSSPDDKDSVGTQIDACREAVSHAGDRRIVGTFSETDVSGFKSERGPELAAAIAEAVKFASDHGEAELWVWHSSRVARGDGRKGHRSLLKVYADLRYEDVQLRSATDDEFVRNPMLVGVASDQNHKYSKDLQGWVQDGKDRQRARGQFMGGPAPDGYTTEHDKVLFRPTKGGTVPFRPRLIDEPRAVIVRRAFELAPTLGDPEIARTLNGEGHRRKDHKPWTRRAIQAMLKNPHYAALTPDGKPLKQTDGVTDVPGIVSAEAFRAAQKARKARDQSAAGRKRADGRPKGGRPATRHALAKLARCARCGGNMYARTSPYKRVDGTQARSYACMNARTIAAKGATCDAPDIDAEAADAANIANLQGYFLDWDSWIARVTEAACSEREKIEAQLVERRARLAKLTAAESAAQDRYAGALADGNPAKIEALERALTNFTSDAAQLRESIAEAEATLSTLEDENPADALLDWWNLTARELRGSLTAADSMATINGKLREVLSGVVMDTLPDGRLWLQATFADHGGRGAHEPPSKVVGQDEHGDLIYELDPQGEWDFVPDQLDMFVRPGGLPVAPIALPVETGPNSHA